MDGMTEETKHQQTYTIEELCREFGVTTRALRFYEQRNLLTPARRGWTRIFSHRDRARLQLILRGKRFGFTLSEIKELLDLYDQDGGQLAQLQVALPKLRGQLELMQRERDELIETIIELERSCQHIGDKLRDRLKRGSDIQDGQ